MSMVVSKSKCFGNGVANCIAKRIVDHIVSCGKSKEFLSGRLALFVG